MQSSEKTRLPPQRGESQGTVQGTTYQRTEITSPQQSQFGQTERSQFAQTERSQPGSTTDKLKSGLQSIKEKFTGQVFDLRGELCATRSLSYHCAFIDHRIAVRYRRRHQSAKRQKRNSPVAKHATRNYRKRAVLSASNISLLIPESRVVPLWYAAGSSRHMCVLGLV